MPAADRLAKSCDCQEPEIESAVKDLIKSAFAPKEPEIEFAVKDLIKSAFAPKEPEIVVDE